jgi:hypothetical protein
MTRKTMRVGAVRTSIKLGTMAPLKFTSRQAALAHAERMSRQETRIVAVERDGWRRVVAAAET